jgi:tight adherence protein B
MVVLVPVSLAGAAVVFAGRSRIAGRRFLQERILGAPAVGHPVPGRRLSARAVASHGIRAPWVAAVLGGGVACLIGGVATAVGGGLAAGVGARVVARRRAMPDVGALDGQVGVFAQGIASGVRGGLSIAQAVAFAAAEAGPPLKPAADEFLAAREVGAPLQAALERMAEQVDTDEIRLLALVLGVHHRSGGNVAVALDDVAATIRQRLLMRRELRALTAQARISGLVLGTLPVAFFLVLALTSRDQLAPVLRSPVGMAMVSVGFLLEGLALLWIRHLLEVDA